MQQTRPTAALLAVGALTIAVIDGAHAQDAFVPGELMIGLASAQDREALIGQMERTRQNLRAGGEAPAALVPQRRGGATMKLKVEFSASVQSRVGADPSAGLQVLEQVAEQIKASNPRIRYAHPNWIMRVDPIEAATADQTEVQRSSPGGSVSAPQQANKLPNDPFFTNGLQWHYQPPPKGMNAVGAWQADIKGSSDIVVAVLDTGQVFNNEDTRGSPNMLKGYNFISYDGCLEKEATRGPDATDTGDACPRLRTSSSWHGTHVAGTIGSVKTNNGVGVAGVNWNVSIVPVRVLGRGGGTVEDIADGILWASGNDVEGVPKIEKRADIINMSLGSHGECSETEYGLIIDAIDQARKAGSVVITAAGNGATLDPQGKVCTQNQQNQQTCRFQQEEVTNHRPSNCPGVISVSAHDSDGVLAPYSNFGTTVNVMAPGGNVQKTISLPAEGGQQTFRLGVWSTYSLWYGAMNGTSMATPHVSGAIALALSKRPEWRGKPDLIAQKLRASLVPPLATSCPPDKPCGAGVLDVMKLINQP